MVMLSTVAAKQRGRHAALRVVGAIQIISHALSTVYVQQPMGVSIYTL